MKSIRYLFTLQSLIFLLTITMGWSQNSNEYHGVFNPTRGLVQTKEQPFRQEISLNGLWKFMPVSSNRMEDFRKPVNFKWDDIPYKVPSPWNVNSFAQGDGGDFVTYPSYPKSWEEATMGWMQKEVELPKNWSESIWKIHFKAIAGDAEVYINGQQVGRGLDIFLPTEYDITSFLKSGKNTILVGVAKASLTDNQGEYGRRNYVAGSFWGQHIAGIWQDVSLLGVPKVHVDDVYIIPDVDKDKLTLTLKVTNRTKKRQRFPIDVEIMSWSKMENDSMASFSVDNGTYGDKVFTLDTSFVVLAPGETRTIDIQSSVKGRLSYWTPDSPNLYGALVRLGRKGGTLDKKITRFGWRQFSLVGSDLLLNGKPISLKGDSWHFMGIPQMTRRYAWGWFKMLKDANANAVRLHAQPFPSFYLDVADEMGICVLDETAIWSSDGGPKMDSEGYWKACAEHVQDLVMRDRNHPSVFGWSVCNETLPVAIHVFHAPDSIVQRQIDEINRWVKIVREYDPSRPWISGDGETMKPTDLPVVIGHYGDESAMEEWSSQGIPWGVGETGMGYYGTPQQVAKINGNSAYESQLGRMEGIAQEANMLLLKQQLYDAAYSSVFNVVWYGLKPLPFGMVDTTRPPKASDGIFFTHFEEGKPGVQPERLGPYTSTLNPGYDGNLPLYDPWPLFEAVKRANSNPALDYKAKESQLPISHPSREQIHKVELLASMNAPIHEQLRQIGIPLVEDPLDPTDLLIIDAGTTLEKSKLTRKVSRVLERGGKIWIMGIDGENVANLNEMLKDEVVLTDRKASSFLISHGDSVLATVENGQLYFSEKSDKLPMQHGISGDVVKKGTVLVEANNTDWRRWNARPEYLKTAAVYRSEQEQKPLGAALVKVQQGGGEVYLTTIDFLALRSDGEKLLKTFFGNLGVVLQPVPPESQKALDSGLELARAMLFFGDPIRNASPDEMTKDDTDYQRTIVQANGKGFFDLKGPSKRGNLSFWVFSPRSLIDLLVEPDMPRLSMSLTNPQAQVYLNGKLLNGQRTDKLKLENLPMLKGWNHFVIPLSQENERQNEIKVTFETEHKAFLEGLDSAVKR